MRISINDESQSSIAKNLRSDELLYYKFITSSPGERIFKIGEHLSKLRAKSLTLSYTPFALHFCPQRCRSRQISWITCVLQTETVSIAMLTGRCALIVKKYQTAVDQFWLTNRLTPSVTDWLLIMYGICCDSFSLLRQLCTVGHGIFYMVDVNNFLLVN